MSAKESESPRQKRREHGSGSIYRRASDGLWMGSIEHGFYPSGARRRIVVSAKSEQAVKRKLRDKKAALARGEATSSRMTIKTWADAYLAMRKRDLSPKGYNAAASPISKWVVPTIGRRRLDQLTPADVRAVADAQRLAGRQSADTHRTLMTMLRAAVADGHHIAPAVLMVKTPRSAKSDRQSMTIDEGLACIDQAATMPNGVRWLFTLLYGQRQGECLGLTWDSIDLDAGAFGEVVIEWQLQSLPYNVPRDRTSGFRVPDDHDARHLVDAYHLTRPKSRAGYRVAPLLEPIRNGMLAWRTLSPESPHGLVWPEPNGRPRNDKHDRADWHALQAAAEVAHPSGRPYHVHECRNFAATMLLEAGVQEHVITDLLGHSSLVTSLKYRTRRREPLLEAMQRVGERLQLG